MHAIRIQPRAQTIHPILRQPALLYKTPAQYLAHRVDTAMIPKLPPNLRRGPLSQQAARCKRSPLLLCLGHKTRREILLPKRRHKHPAIIIITTTRRTIIYPWSLYFLSNFYSDSDGRTIFIARGIAGPPFARHRPQHCGSRGFPSTL